MKLIEVEKLKKFWSILQKLDRHTSYVYIGYDKKNPHITKCQKEVFVNRTISKYFKSKALKLYCEGDAGEYIRYISINSINFVLGYGDKIQVYYYDYSRPTDIWKSLTLSFNDILDLEGEWCKDLTEHVLLLEMCMLKIPKKKYIFQFVDNTKFPKRVKKGIDILSVMSSDYVIEAKTEKEAYKIKNTLKFENGYLYQLLRIE